MSEHHEQTTNAGDGRTRAGRGWYGDPQGHARAGRKGGQRVSRDREHMREIGRRGGLAVSADREHMAAIGRKGGQRGSRDPRRLSRGSRQERTQGSPDRAVHPTA